MGAVFNAVAMDAQGTVIGVGVVVVSLLSVLLVVLLFLFFAIVLPKRVFHSIQGPLNGKHDSLAWYVTDVEAWVRRIGALTRGRSANETHSDTTTSLLREQTVTAAGGAGGA